MTEEVTSTNLSRESIIKNLRYAEVFEVETRKEVDSTNDEIKEKINKGAREWLVVVADSQKKGRGTKGRSFFSPEKTGVYMSILVRPDKEIVPYLTSLTAVSVAKAIENLNGNVPSIKWVNDIYAKGKKCAGILTESVSVGSSFSHAVIGIGINVFAPKSGFPDDIKDIAGVAFDNGDIELKNKLIAEVLNVFYEFYKRFDKENILKEYKSRSFLDGKRVVVVSQSSEQFANVLGVDDEFGLVVKFYDGTIKSLNSGEVKIVW